MAIYRVHKSKNFTIMSNHHLRNMSLSLKAKGLLSLMLSLPDDWDYSKEGLATLSKDGKDSVQASLVELEENGYLVRSQSYDGKGQFKGYIYDIYELPIMEYPLTENPLTENPSTGNPLTENPSTENPTQIITNKPTIKELKTKDIYIVGFDEIVDYLNLKAEKNYKSSSRKTRDLIRARMNDGFDINDFKKVIDNKCRSWKGTNMDEFLRPETLFGTKFEGYLNEKYVPKKGELNPEAFDW